MEVERYEVQVLHLLSPHQLWLLPLRPAGHTDRWRLEQAGVHGVLAQCCRVDPVRDRMVMETSPEWGPAAAQLLRQLFRGRRVWFAPTRVTMFSHSIFDDNIYKFGEFYIQDETNNFKEVSKALIESSLAMVNPQSFTTLLESGALHLKLNSAETNSVLGAIVGAKVETTSHQWKAMVYDQMRVYFLKRRFATEVNDNCGDKFAEAQSVIARKQDDLEFFCKGVDNEFLVANEKMKLTDSNGRRVQMAKRFLALQKKRNEMTSLANDKDAAIHEGPEKKNGENAKSAMEMKDNSAPILRADDEYNPKLKYKNHWDSNMSEEEFPLAPANNICQSDVGEDSFVDRIPTRCKGNDQNNDILDSIGSLKFVPRHVESFAQGSQSSDDTRSLRSAVGVEESSYPRNSNLTKRIKVMQMTMKKNNIQSNISTTGSSEHTIASSSDDDCIKLEIKRLDQARSQLIQKLNAKSNCNRFEKCPIDSPKPLIEEIVSHSTTKIEEAAQTTQQVFKKKAELQNVKQNELLKPEDKLSSENMESDNISLDETDDLDSPIKLVPSPKDTPNRQLEHIERLNYELPIKKCKTDFIEKIVTPQLMIHTKNNIRIKPVTELGSIHFTNKIHNILQQTGCRTPMSLQTVSWPCILRGHSFFTVNPRGSGKTMGYVPAVCRLVVDNKNHDNAGPVCIIICDTAKSVDEVVTLCNTFLKGDKIVRFCYAGVDRNQLIKNMLNGCDILVCTPFHLINLFSVGHFSLDLSCLSIVVLDGCDRIDRMYSSEFKFFYSQINKMLSIRVNKHHQIQFIVTSNEWCNMMLQLAMKALNSVICIGFYQECAVYSKAHTSVVFDMLGSKVDTLVQFLKEVDATKRTVIVCKTNAEIQEIKEKLTSLKYTVISGGTDLSIQQVYIMDQSWFQYDLPCIAPVLVCCDENLRYLNITNAHYLVHYSLPDTFTSFCKRFAVLIDHYKSIFNDESESNVKIKILVDSENTEQLPKLLNFIKRCTNSIPEVLNEISEKILIEKDKVKALSYTPLCDSLLGLGQCPDFWYCNKRHTLHPIRDKSAEWVPRKGIITFKILHYHSAVHYSAEVISHTVNGKKTELPLNQNKKITMKLNIHFCNESNKKLHGIPELGDICAVSTSPGYYERCQVIRILSYYEKAKPKLVVVNLIDEEKEYTATDVELLHLPETFNNMLSHVVQVRLGNIRPKDRDISFSEMSRSFLERILKEEGQMYLRANIALVIGNTVIVEELEACRDMSTTSDTVVTCRVKESLCENHADPNEDHVLTLTKLCKIAGLFLPAEDHEDVELPKEIKQLPKPQWAHLESDDFPLVYFSSADNPGKFYVRLVRFDACLNNLIKDIQKYVGALKDNNKDRELEKGDLVIARFPDDLLYYRAMIDSTPVKHSNEKIRCFFVDHGDWRTVSRVDVHDITEPLITLLPFQAIECRLIGLRPVGEEWNEWSTNYFADLCFQDAKDDSLRELYVKYLVKEVPECTGGHKYGIVIIDTSSEEDIIINDVMLNANVAILNEDEKHFLENISFTKPNMNEMSDGDDSDIIDEEWKKEAAPYKNVVYERKLDIPLLNEIPLPIPTTFPEKSVMTEITDKVRKLSTCSSFDADAFDAELSDDECLEILGINSKPSEKKGLPQLTLPGTRSASPRDEMTNTTKPIPMVSSCSSYEVIRTPRIKELDSDYISSPDISESEVLSANNNIDLMEKSDNELVPSSECNSDSINQNSISGKKHTPKLSWHQTKINVTVKIEVTQINDYKLDIDRKSMTFETRAHDTEYGFTLKFFGAVDPEKCSHSPKGQYVLIKLTKLLKLNWLTLNDGVKRRWITYNPDLLGDDINDEDGDTFVLKKEFDEFVKERADRMDDDDPDDLLDDIDDIGDMP